MRYNESINLKLYSYTDSQFKLQAIIDDYQEISFTHNLYEAGDFIITINYNIPNASKFSRGMFVQFGNDSYMFGEITNITDSIGEDGKGSQLRVISGKDARYLFKRRIIRQLNNSENWSMTAKGELCLRNLIKDQCGAGAEAKRQLPISNTIPSSSEAIGKEFSVAESYSNLYDVLVTIATQSEIGWRLKFDGSLTLEVFEGNDISNQVQFSTDFDSLSNGTFQDSSESYANTIYVGGKGTGIERDIYEGEQIIDGDTPEGLDRFEAWDNQSDMTNESDYEAEALSMLTQYGQNINVSGKGLAKCPYEFKKQYDIGDIITLAFSGKKAKTQILSVSESWVKGSYNIDFNFGKPVNGLDRELQLILKQIQKATNKTNATSSVKWYTIPDDAEMDSSDVIFDTLGFTGNMSNDFTFTLYLDDEKTGSKNYNLYVKNLAGSGKLTLTTGRQNATNVKLSIGSYVAEIYIDESGNITLTTMSPVNSIIQGSEQPVTSGAVYDAIGGGVTFPLGYVYIQPYRTPTPAQIGMQVPENCAWVDVSKQYSGDYFRVKGARWHDQMATVDVKVVAYNASTRVVTIESGVIVEGCVWNRDVVRNNDTGTCAWALSRTSETIGGVSYNKTYTLDRDIGLTVGQYISLSHGDAMQAHRHSGTTSTVGNHAHTSNVGVSLSNVAGSNAWCLVPRNKQYDGGLSGTSGGAGSHNHTMTTGGIEAIGTNLAQTINSRDETRVQSTFMTVWQVQQL